MITETPLVAVPCYISPELLAKIRAATDAITPGKRGKLTLSLDDHGTVSAGVGAKFGSHVTLGAVVARDTASGLNWGATATIEWAP
jgi:hypothetical protein